MTKIIRLLLGVGLTATFLWLIFRQIDIEQIEASLRSANPYWIVLAIGTFFAGYACRIERWKIMLIHENRNLSWLNCAGPLMASVAANNLLPFRTGDAIRSFGFNRRLGISAGTSVSSLFLERLLDSLMLGISLGIALRYFDMDASDLLGLSGTSLIAGGMIMAVLLLYPRLVRPFATVISKFIARLVPSFGSRIEAEVRVGLDTLERASEGHLMLQLLTWSALAWLAEGLVFWFTALSLSSLINPEAAALALPIGTLATVIPSAPGYVGTFDYFTSQAMMALQNNTDASTAYALLVHMVLWLPPCIVGGLYLLINPLRSHNEPRDSYLD